jgi:hypothetical protein
VTISGDYPQPVQVNGFTCRNCTDVDYAKKHIDPAHPKSGPYDVDAATDPSRGRAVLLGGALARRGSASDSSTQSGYRAGQTLDVRA